jgi:hypothetical protein
VFRKDSFRLRDPSNEETLLIHVVGVLGQNLVFILPNRFFKSCNLDRNVISISVYMGLRLCKMVSKLSHCFPILFSQFLDRKCRGSYENKKDEKR